jgi:hypothetical protein
MRTLLGALLAWHAALGGRVVLMRHMLSGHIKGDKKMYQLDFQLLHTKAVAALSTCANVDVGRSGAPSPVAVPGGYHWSVCWTRLTAAAQPLTFLRAVAAVMDPLDVVAGARPPGGRARRGRGCGARVGRARRGLFPSQW